MHNVIFNEKCLGWTKDAKTNNFFLIYNLHYLSDLFTTRGYIYLNQIFEQIGALWNPDFENICYRSDGNGLPYKIKHIEDADFMVTIHD